MKKIISIMLALAMIFTMSSIACASEDYEEKEILKPETIIINEYLSVKELAGKNESDLSAMGFDIQDIGKIKNYKAESIAFVHSLGQYSVDQLLEFGYSVSQIDIIYNFHETEEELIATSASLSLTTDILNFVYDDYTTGTFHYYWAWSGIPNYKLRDMVAVSWNGWAVTGNSSSVSYYSLSNGTFYGSYSATFSQDGNGTDGAGHKFQLLKNDYYYAKIGSGNMSIQSDVHASKDIYYYVEYGHSYVYPTISFSVGTGGGSASISFSAGVSVEDTDYQHFVPN